MVSASNKHCNYIAENPNFSINTLAKIPQCSNFPYSLIGVKEENLEPQNLICMFEDLRLHNHKTVFMFLSPNWCIYAVNMSEWWKKPQKELPKNLLSRSECDINLKLFNFFLKVKMTSDFFLIFKLF